ncbi:hypothetical protein LEP1GSC036_2262 [Leptospira weilii str. 2006001853]|uniref:Uncharacterized protein n=1 Tax=Leptospira weilii str. 2006001853 TaxID=1001589 RepID=A0A828YXS9_9LEPT|nr:hypothetical protein LEP1GSC036_2262 [Leptospira weilii str. 2006001853]
MDSGFSEYSDFIVSKQNLIRGRNWKYCTRTWRKRKKKIGSETLTNSGNVEMQKDNGKPTPPFQTKTPST